jgi:hypothetical protein
LTKVSYKRAGSPRDETETKAKHSKESERGLNQPSTCNRNTALLHEESEDQQHNTVPQNTPKPRPIYITGVKNISQFIQLLEQLAK